MADNVGPGGGLRLVETWMVSRTQSMTGPHLAPWGAARAPSDTAGDPASTEAGVALFSVGAAVTVRASTPRRRCPNAATAENYKQDKAEGGDSNAEVSERQAQLKAGNTRRISPCYPS